MQRGKAIYMLLLWMICGELYGQNYIYKNDIPVTHNGDTLRAAWTGGLNSPQFSEVDLDNDGIMDLLVFDRYDNTLLTFTNKGTANTIDYDFAPEFIDAFPSGLTKWLLTRDFDGDGFMDIFTNVPGSSYIRVFRNQMGDNGGSLAFSLYQDTIFTDYPPFLPLYSSKADIPSIADVDEDGDLDIVTFHVSGSLLEWHRNMSMEQYGNLSALEFIAQSRCFGHYKEDAQTCSAYLNQTPCNPGQRMDPEAEFLVLDGQHAGSTSLMIDLNGDSLKEMIIGDVDCNTFYALRNAGTFEIAHFDYVEDNYPAQDVSVDLPVFPAAYYLDVDNDGLKDLISAPNATNKVEDKSGVWLHKNTGLNNWPSFGFVKTGFLQDEMIETGTGTAPIFFDHNGDGLIDMLVGNYGRFDTAGGFTTRLHLFENTGSAQLPAFELVDEDYFDLDTNTALAFLSWAIPEVGDLDGDGDEDLLLGDERGKLIYFENTGGSGNPVNFVLTDTSYAGIDVGLFSAPELYDMDGDLDPDLLIGNHRGYVHYYENTGTASLPNFVFVTDTFGYVKINDFTGEEFSNGFSRPRVLDLDNDSQVELLVGSLEGPIEVYENVSLNPGATFTRSTDFFGKDFGAYSVLAVAELDSSKPTYAIGNYRGGLWLLRDGGPVSKPSPVQVSELSFELFPNPADRDLNIRLNDYRGGELHLELFNLYGQSVRSQSIRSAETRIDVSGLPDGVYVLLLRGNDRKGTKKLIIRSRG